VCERTREDDISAHQPHRRQQPGRRQERQPPIASRGEAAAVEVEVLVEEARGAAKAERGQVWV